MAKRKPPPVGRCVHCLVDNVPRNWDHVFPRGWYPDSTPPNTSKWIVPTCVKCNSRLGAIEQKLLTALAICIDPTTAGTVGITQRVLRGLDVRHAKSERDAMFRLRNLRQVVAGLLYGETLPDNGFYPGLGERWGRSKEQVIGVKIPAAYFKALSEKIARGIAYIEDGRYIEASHQITFYAWDESANASLLNNLFKDAVEYVSGPGISVRRIDTVDDASTAFAINVWQTFKMFVTVRPVK